MDGVLCYSTQERTDCAQTTVSVKYTKHTPHVYTNVLFLSVLLVPHSVDTGTISTNNQRYTQQDINTQLYAEATPPDTTYSRLTRDDKRTDEIATYDYADPNQIRVERSQATNPPPVSGEATMREKEFYNAEDHTYAAVNKKAKKKKKLKNVESDGEGEGEVPPSFVSTLAEV